MNLSTQLDYQEAQPSWKVGWWRAGNYNLQKLSSFFATLSLLLGFLFQFDTASAQITPCTNCTAKDVGVDIAKVELVQLNPAYVAGNGEPKYISFAKTCTGSQPFVGILKISIDQNATTRYGYRFKGNIYIDGVYVSSFSFCDPNTFSSGQYDLYVESPGITWTCGTKLELKNLFVGWGNNTTDDVCATDACSLEPHCKQFSLEQSFVVVTPLSANFTYLGSCPAGNTAQSYSFDALASTGGTTGGSLPYTGFTWSIKNSSYVEVATMMGSNPTYDFSPLGVGTYTVELTVTDDDPTATSEISHTINVVSCCTPTNAPVVASQICEGATSVSGTSAANASIIVYKDVSGTPTQIGTATADGNGNWTATVSPALSSENVITATATAPGGCLSNASSGVTVQSNSTAPSVTTPVTYCVGQTASALSATTTQGATVTWYDANNVALNGAPTPSTATAGSTDYYVSQTETGKCESAKTKITVTVKANSTAPSVTTPVTYCVGQTASALSATTAQGATVTWYDANNVALNGAPTPSTATAGSTDYYVSQTETGKCESAKTKITVTVKANSTGPSVTTPVTYCVGQTASALSATTAQGATVTWYDANNVALNGAPTPSTATAGSTDYYVSQTETGKCESAKTKITVTVKANSTGPSVTTPVKYCVGQTASALSATTAQGATVTWYDANNVALNGAPTPSTATAGSTDYYVSQTETGKCESVKAKITVTVQAYTASPTVTPICDGATSVSGTNVSGASVSVAIGSGSPIAATVSGTTWSLTGLSALSAGTVVSATASKSGECISSAGTATVKANTAAPTINAICTGATSVSGTNVSGASVSVTIGNASPRAATVSGTSWSLTGLSALNAGTVVSATATVVGMCTSAASTATVDPNSICPTYTGVYFTNTSSTTTGGSATFNLTYTITKVGCSGASGLTAANFTVGSSSDNSVTIKYGTNTFNSSTGLLTIPVTVTLGNNVYSAGVTFTLALLNARNYAISSSGSCSDPVLVTVSTKTDGFVTGGGYIIPKDSKGTIGDRAIGLRTNFGFNIKYNKSGTNLQGNWNMIIRTSTGLWQVKSSQPTYLSVTPIPNTSFYKADMVFSAANIKNLTTGTGYGTGTVNVTVYDNGEPGSGVDQIFIKVTDGAINYYTSSLSTTLSTPSTIQKLDVGNIQVHTLGAKASSAAIVANTTEAQVIQSLSDKLNISAFPNPYTDNVKFVIQSPVSGQATLDVFNMLGQKIKTVFQGNVIAGIGQSVEYNVPKVNAGNLMYILRVGNHQATGKLIH